MLAKKGLKSSWQVKQEKGASPPSSTNVATSAATAASHPMAAEALAAQANFEVNNMLICIWFVFFCICIYISICVCISICAYPLPAEALFAQAKI